MDTIKSQSVYLNITQALLTEIGSASNVHWFTPSDARLTCKKLSKRFEAEGIGLLTKTLPRFCKALDRALSGTQPFVLIGFATEHGLPKFLGEFTRRVFESDGWLKPDPCTESITTLRLITGLWKKLELKYEKQQEESVLSAFTAAEDELACTRDEYVEIPSGVTPEWARRAEPTTVSDLATCSCFPSERDCPIQGDSLLIARGHEGGVSNADSADHDDDGNNIQKCPGGPCGLSEHRGCGVGSGVANGQHASHDGDSGVANLRLGLRSRAADSYQESSRVSGQDGAGLGETASDARDQISGSEAYLKAYSCPEAYRVIGTGFWDEPVRLSISGPQWDHFSRKDLVSGMNRLLTRLFCSFDPYDITPSHGPGAVSHGEKPWEKRFFKRFYKRLDSFYPYDQYFYWSSSHLCDELNTLQSLKDSIPIARVCLVPKDSRGPRVISCEPLELMWIQQGLMRALYAHIDAHPLTKGCVQFIDQSTNNRLAREGSDAGLATIDLKEASDRVPHSLVKRVFPSPLREALDSARSIATTLPNGRILRLDKFAPMGSSLCFPVMALTIWSCIVTTLMHKYSISNPSKIVGRVFVYGDDVIVPECDAPEAIAALEVIGLKINYDKSYITGQFKESCGGFYFRGHDVTGLLIRTPFSSSWSPEVYASWIDYSNQFYKRGYLKPAGYIADLLRSIYGIIPVNDETKDESPCPALVHREGTVFPEKGVPRRWNPQLFCWEFSVLALTPKKVRARKVGWCDILDSAGRGYPPSWPPLRHARDGNIHVTWLDCGLVKNASCGDPNPRLDRPGERTGIDYRWYSMRKRSKLRRTWMSGGGLS